MKRVLLVFLSALLALQLSGCASISGEGLEIDVRDVPGVRHMPDELTDMLRDLGYDWIHLEDPVSNRGVKVVQKEGEYRMRFEYLETGQARIDIRVRRQDGFTWLNFYEVGSQALSPAGEKLFMKLKARAEQEFGAANISH